MKCLIWGMWRLDLQVKEISGMNEDSLFLVVPDSNYTRRVPISIVLSI